MAVRQRTGPRIVTMRSEAHEAYQYCLRKAKWHYENFPVASHAVPGKYREAVATLYAFARTADDFADEGDDAPETRLARLAEYRERLEGLARDERQQDPIFIALADVRRRYDLPLEPLHDLLDAFSQDVTKLRYADISEVLAYCRRSACPIGRMMLHLFECNDDDSVAKSDQLCTAFQLTNFLQDLEQDWQESGRIYLPQDEMQLHGVSEDHFRMRRTDAAMLALIAMQVARIRRMLADGAPLAWRLPGRIGFELRMIVFGVRRIVDKLTREQHDVFRRPRLGKRDWLWVTAHASAARRL